MKNKNEIESLELNMFNLSEKCGELQIELLECMILCSSIKNHTNIINKYLCNKDSCDKKDIPNINKLLMNIRKLKRLITEGSESCFDIEEVLKEIDVIEDEFDRKD